MPRVWVIFLSVMVMIGAPALADGPPPADNEKASTQDLVTLPPRGAPFDAEILARIRASLRGTLSSDSKAKTKSEGDH